MSEIADASAETVVSTETDSAVEESQTQVVETTDTPEIPSPDQAEGSQDSGEGDSPETEKVKKHNSFQERINQKTRQAKEAEERAQVAEQRSRFLESQIQNQEQSPYPTLESFDYDADRHAQALSQWNAQQTTGSVHSALAQQERMQAQQMKQQAQAAVVEAFRERSNQFAVDYPDYQETVTNPRVPLNQTITQAVVMADNGPAIAYHLAKNPELAMEISRLPGPQAMMRLGQVSGQLQQPVVTKQTQAPAPAKAPTGGSGKVAKDPEKMTPNEYAKYRGYR